MKLFKLNKEYQIVCQSENTRYGFRHLATLIKNGYERDNAKCCYYNRTWERYTFQSVLSKLIKKCKEITEKQRAMFLRKIELGYFN